MSEYKKPLPEIQPYSQPFWDGTRENKLLVQHCNACDTNIFYPRRDCPECWSQDLGWIEASGRAIVYTYSVTYEGVEGEVRRRLADHSRLDRSARGDPDAYQLGGV